MQIRSWSLDSFSEAEVETRVQHENGRSAVKAIASIMPTLISARGRARARAQSPTPPAALCRPQSQSPAAAGGRTSRFLVAGLRRSRWSSSGAGQNRRAQPLPETEPCARSRRIEEVRERAVRWDTAGETQVTPAQVAMSPGEDGLIGIPFPEHSSELLSRLNAQRRTGLLCDLTLTSRGARYPTHRSVMAAVSLYFRRLFGAEEGEEGGEGVGDNCSVCQLDCVSPDALAALLEFAYTATLTIRSSGMREVLKGAQLLGIQCVADACRDILGETETGDDLTEDLPSRRKQHRCSVTRAVSPVRPVWRSPAAPAPEETPECGLLPVQGHPGHLLVNGSSHWPQEFTPIPQRPEDTPSEEEESGAQGRAMPRHSQSQGDGGAGGGATAGGGRKRKSQTPQQCPVCQKIIHGAGKLPRHMRTHTGEKPFQCTACGVRFTRNDKLKIHMRKHTGERPYPCPSCPARFLHSYDLKNHLSLHSGDRPFECPLCHKAFAREDHLQRHRKGHSCLELRTRRQRRPTGPEAESFGLHPGAAQLLQGHGGPLLTRMPYPELLWRAVAAPAGEALDKAEGGSSPHGSASVTHPAWDEEEEEQEAAGEEEE